MTVHNPLFFRIFIWSLNARIGSRDNWTLAQNGRLDWVRGQDHPACFACLAFFVRREAVNSPSKEYLLQKHLLWHSRKTNVPALFFIRYTTTRSPSFLLVSLQCDSKESGRKNWRKNWYTERFSSRAVSRALKVREKKSGYKCIDWKISKPYTK